MCVKSRPWHWFNGVSVGGGQAHCLCGTTEHCYQLFNVINNALPSETQLSGDTLTWKLQICLIKCSTPALGQRQGHMERVWPENRRQRRNKKDSTSCDKLRGHTCMCERWATVSEICLNLAFIMIQPSIAHIMMPVGRKCLGCFMFKNTWIISDSFNKLQCMQVQNIKKITLLFGYTSECWLQAVMFHRGTRIEEFKHLTLHQPLPKDFLSEALRTLL